MYPELSVFAAMQDGIRGRFTNHVALDTVTDDRPTVFPTADDNLDRVVRFIGLEKKRKYELWDQSAWFIITIRYMVFSKFRMQC